MVTPVKDILEQLLHTADGNWRFHVIRQWKELVGDLHTRMRLEKITEHTLVVGVYDSHWMQELHLISPLIIRTINAGLGHPYVKRIQFKLARHKELPKKRNNSPVPSPQQRPLVLTAQQRQALHTLPDGELREVLTAFLARCYRERG